MEPANTTHGSDGTRRRRWFRFSLRTLFVVLTVFGCWLGYQLNWIRQRNAIVADFPRWLAYEGTTANPPPPAPGMLWMFGAKGYHTVVRVVPNGNDAAVATEIEMVQRLFPEASVDAAAIHLDPPTP
jgi:hypothetical protein